MKHKMIKENDEKLEEEKQIREEELKLIFSDEKLDLVEEIEKKRKEIEEQNVAQTDEVTSLKNQLLTSQNDSKSLEHVLKKKKQQIENEQIEKDTIKEEYIGQIKQKEKEIHDLNKNKKKMTEQEKEKN
jgi:hypothetical protein